MKTEAEAHAAQRTCRDAENYGIVHIAQCTEENNRLRIVFSLHGQWLL